MQDEINNLQLEEGHGASPDVHLAMRNRDGWISVKDRLPEVGQLVLVYEPPRSEDWPDSIRISFDCIDPDADDPTCWLHHSEHYEHYCCVAKPEGSVGPSAEAPYTHWHPLPPPPADIELAQLKG